MLIKIMKDTGSTKTGYDTAFPVLSYLISPFQAYTPEQNAERKEWLECIRSYKNSDNIEERELYRLAQHELKAITRELRNTEPKELTPKAYDLVYELINLSPHVHKYTSLVLSHSADDNEKLLQNPEAMFEARQLMEEYAFAGIGEQDKASYWVEHTDKFRFEDHGVFPRIHPTTMKYFNPFPPGCERVLNLIRDYINLKYDLADPMSSARVKYFSAIGRYDSNRNFKQQLYDDLNKKLELGAFQTRWDVVNYLKSSEFEEKHGCEYVKASSRYLVVKKLGGATLRLKGRLFDERFDYNVKVLSRVEKARESEETRLELLAELEKEMDEAFQKRAAYNRIKYKTNDAVGKRGRTPLREQNTNELIDRVISILDIKGMIEIPKLSDHMAHWEREQAYKAIQHTIALIKSKELANPLTLQQNIEAFQKVMAMIEEFLYGCDYKPLRGSSRAFEDRTERINGRISGTNQELAGKIRTSRTGSDEARTTRRESHATTEQVVRVLGRLRESFGQVFEIPTEKGGMDGRTVEATERKTRYFELRNQELKDVIRLVSRAVGREVAEMKQDRISRSKVDTPKGYGYDS